MNENGVPTGQYEKVYREEVDWNDALLVKTDVSEDEYKLSYSDWGPQKGDRGQYKATCAVKYKIDGTGWFGTNLFAETFTSEKVKHNLAVDVKEYDIFARSAKKTRANCLTKRRITLKPGTPTRAITMKKRATIVGPTTRNVRVTRFLR